MTNIRLDAIIKADKLRTPYYDIKPNIISYDIITIMIQYIILTGVSPTSYIVMA